MKSDTNNLCIRYIIINHSEYYSERFKNKRAITKSHSIYFIEWTELSIKCHKRLYGRLGGYMSRNKLLINTTIGAEQSSSPMDNKKIK